MKKTNVVVRITAAAALVAALTSVSTHASDCKGLEANNCAVKSSCSWVDGYTRKDGRQVKSFCRAKPSSKAKAALKQSKSQAALSKPKASSIK